MDDPDALESEWARKNAVPALAEYYDEIWVYGLPQICDPLAGLPVPASVRRRMIYTGYLRRSAGEPLPAPEIRAVLDREFLLVTPGGGGDGDALIDLVLQAYEYDRDIPLAALLVYGPFMLPEQQAAFTARAERLPNVHAITFDARLEAMMARAAGVVAMGGYNTFCEILSFDKPALIVPRNSPEDGAADPRRASRRARAGGDARRRQRRRPKNHGDGAAPPAPATASLLGGDPRPARWHA